MRLTAPTTADTRLTYDDFVRFPDAGGGAYGERRRHADDPAAARMPHRRASAVPTVAVSAHARSGQWRDYPERCVW